jgi:hypothetical protein
MKSLSRIVCLSILPILAILAGYFWGMSLTYGNIGKPPNQFTYVGVLAIALLVLGQVYAIDMAWQNAPSSQDLFAKLSDESPSVWLPVLLSVYGVLVVVTDPFLDAPNNYEEMAFKVILLLPFVLSCGHFFKKGNFIGVIGTCMFLAACVAVLFFNTRYSDWWVGFSTWAIS